MNFKFKSDNKSELVERYVLQGFISNPRLLSGIKDKLHKEHFYTPSCSKLYQFLVEVYNATQKVLSYDELDVEVERRIADLHQREELMMLIKILRENVKLTNEKYNINVIEEFFKKQKTKEIIIDIMGISRRGDDDYQQADFDRIIKEIETVNYKMTKADFVSLFDLDKVFSGLKSLKDEKNIIPSGLHKLNQCLTYGGYLKGTVNVVTAPPKSGKSSFMVFETANAAKLGKKVLHIFLGDLSIRDGWIRLCSNFMGGEFTQNKLVTLNVEDFKTLLFTPEMGLSPMKNVYMAAFPSALLTADELYEECLRAINEHFKEGVDMIVVDYIDNLLYNNDSLYERGGRSFSMLEKLAVETNSAVLTASQPKSAYFDEEVIYDINVNAESSKKEAMMDLNLILGKKLPLKEYGKAVSVMTIGLNRRGESGRSIYIEFDFNFCSLREITQDEYKDLRTEIAREDKEVFGKRKRV